MSNLSANTDITTNSGTKLVWKCLHVCNHIWIPAKCYLLLMAFPDKGIIHAAWRICPPSDTPTKVSLLFPQNMPPNEGITHGVPKQRYHPCRLPPKFLSVSPSKALVRVVQRQRCHPSHPPSSLPTKVSYISFTNKFPGKVIIHPIPRWSRYISHLPIMILSIPSPDKALIHPVSRQRYYPSCLPMVEWFVNELNDDLGSRRVEDACAVCCQG